jgi:hypothetical protein
MKTSEIAKRMLEIWGQDCPHPRREIRKIREWLSKQPDLDDVTDEELDRLWDQYHDDSAMEMAEKMFRRIHGDVKFDAEVFDLYRWLRHGAWSPWDDNVNKLVKEYREWLDYWRT